MTTSLEQIEAPSPTTPPRSVEPGTLASAWQLPLAASAIVAAAAHVPVTMEHLAEAPYIGVLFILLEIAATASAMAILVRPTRLVYLGTAAIGAAAVGMLVLSRTVGLPLIGDDIGNWTEPLAIVSVAAETIMLVGGAAAASVARPPSLVAVRVTTALGALLLVVGASAIGVAAGAQADHEGDSTGMAGMRM